MALKPRHIGSPVIDDFVYQSDAGCWLQRPGGKADGKAIFIYDDPAKMVINGEKVALTQQSSHHEKALRFEGGHYLVMVDFGPMISQEALCGRFDRFTKATITVWDIGNPKLKTTLKAKGACGCG